MSINSLIEKLEFLTGNKVILEAHIDASDYANKQYQAKLITGQIGNLYHATAAIAARGIIKNKAINPANIVHKDIIGKLGEPQPWWHDDEFGEPEPFYGDFIYAAVSLDSNHYGVSDPDVVFEIDGNKLKNVVDIYQAPQTMEDGVCLINGSVPLQCIKKVILNTSTIHPKEKKDLETLLQKSKIAYVNLKLK